jgi:uncharacterized protein (UPF0332 family)
MQSHHTEFEAARSDLAWARQSFADYNDKWAAIQACYSVFHAARALLLAKGYRGRNRNHLKGALLAFYVDDGALEREIVDDFDKAMRLRETADSRCDFTRQGAIAALERAERFLAKAEELLAA